MPDNARAAMLGRVLQRGRAVDQRMNYDTTENRHKNASREAVEKLAAEEGIVANQLAIKWIVPFHVEAVTRLLSRSKKIIIIENNFTGQFARYLRSETGIAAHGHIRKYDGEPFMPHHIVNAVKEQLAGKSKLSVPQHEIMV